MARTSTASAPTGDGFKPTGAQEKTEVVLSYCVAASTSITAGDFVTISTSAGTISRCAAANAVFDGIALNTYNNTSTSASTGYEVAVLRKGVTFVDAVAKSGDNAASITYHDLVYLAAAVDSVGSTGQCVSMYSTSCTLVGRCFDKVTAPAAATLFQVRVYIDTLLKPTPIA